MLELSLRPRPICHRLLTQMFDHSHIQTYYINVTQQQPYHVTSSFKPAKKRIALIAHYCRRLSQLAICPFIRHTCSRPRLGLTGCSLPLGYMSFTLSCLTVLNNSPQTRINVRTSITVHILHGDTSSR